jgi:hypothetical protein
LFINADNAGIERQRAAASDRQFAVQIFELSDKFPADRKGGIIQSQLARSMPLDLPR